MSIVKPVSGVKGYKTEAFRFLYQKKKLKFRASADNEGT
jgi:hypothetical protein